MGLLSSRKDSEGLLNLLLQRRELVQSPGDACVALWCILECGLAGQRDVGKGLKLWDTGGVNKKAPKAEHHGVVNTGMNHCLANPQLMEELLELALQSDKLTTLCDSGLVFSQVLGWPVV